MEAAHCEGWQWQPADPWQGSGTGVKAPCGEESCLHVETKRADQNKVCVTTREAGGASACLTDYVSCPNTRTQIHLALLSRGGGGVAKLFMEAHVVAVPMQSLDKQRDRIWTQPLPRLFGTIPTKSRYLKPCQQGKY